LCLDPEWTSVDRGILSISGRTIAAMFHDRGHNEILRVQATSERDCVDVNLAYIGPAFRIVWRQQFGPEYMRALFDYGCQQARTGYPWRKSHPMRDAMHRAIQSVQAL
jgi:hypothetical protein